MGQRESRIPREEEREWVRARGRRGANDPRVCESMPGFNDQQRGRGCILAAVEKQKECRDAGGEGGRKKGARQANNAGRKKARGKNCAEWSLGGPQRERATGTTHGVRYWRTLSHYWLPLRVRASTMHGKAKKTNRERSYRCKLSVLSRLFCISLSLGLSYFFLYPFARSLARIRRLTWRILQ